MVRLHHDPGSGLIESAGTLKRTDAPSARRAISSVRRQTWPGPDEPHPRAVCRARDVSLERPTHSMRSPLGSVDSHWGFWSLLLTRKVEPIRAMCGGCTCAPRSRAVDGAGHSATRTVRARKPHIFRSTYQGWARLVGDSDGPARFRFRPRAVPQSRRGFAPKSVGSA